MAAAPELLVSKLDAAKRQLEVAIRLHFAWGDPVAIHTLASAAVNVLADINAHRRGPGPSFRKEMLNRVKPEHRAFVSRKIREAENFFKHADNDPDAVLPFRPQASEFVLFDAVELYFSLSREMPPILRTYRMWWFLENKDLVKPDAPAEFRRTLEDVPINSNDRSAFFQQVLPAISQMSLS